MVSYTSTRGGHGTGQPVAMCHAADRAAGADQILLHGTMPDQQGDIVAAARCSTVNGRSLRCCWLVVLKALDQAERSLAARWKSSANWAIARR